MAFFCSSVDVIHNCTLHLIWDNGGYRGELDMTRLKVSVQSLYLIYKDKKYIDDKKNLKIEKIANFSDKMLLKTYFSNY